MKISLDWLRQYVAPGLPAGEIAEILTMGGLEVDAVTPGRPPLPDGVVVGHVENVRPHPNADRLVLCDVLLGEGGDENTSTQIACGAPNVEAGQRVPVATVGTALMLPGENGERTPATIEAVELRGERSAGMICSEQELGIGPDASGIMVLPADAPVGQSLSDYLAAQGHASHEAPTLDIDLTPNRPDAASHLGVARDLAALTGTALERPEVALPEKGAGEESPRSVAEAVSVEIEDDEACPRYAALLVRGIENGDSPAWLKARLASIGLQPQSAVVDVANFVMHECGQPLHTFDFERIAGQAITVRSATQETPLTTLDGAERTAPPGTLLICDAERPVALAGLMGGSNSEVRRDTTDVLIESAYFDPSTIRRAAKALDLSTDASYRFERGVDRDGQMWAAARAAHLIAELTGGTVVPGFVDEQPQGPPAPHVVTLRPDRANAVLGTALSAEAMRALLAAVGFETDSKGDTLTCTVPLFRPDVTREEDLIEEVARLHGYDQIPAPAHVRLPARPPREEATRRLRRRLRHSLAGMGLREIQTNSMWPTAQARQFLPPSEGAAGEDRGESNDRGEKTRGDVARTLKPISEAMAALRPRLLPGVLEAMRFNRNRGQTHLRFFEFGHVFRQTDEPGMTVPGYAEHEALLIALSGPAQASSWDTDARETDFYDAKGITEHLLSMLRIGDAEMEPFGMGADPNFEYGLRLTAPGGAPLGLVGKVSEATAAGFDVERPVFAAELRWDTLIEAAASSARRYEEPPRFPAVERDLAVVVDENVPAEALRRTIRAADDTPLLASVRLFDQYAGEGVGEGRKSLAFALRFQADRTLEDAEVDAEVERIVSLLAADHSAQLRQ